jgi:serine/threonine protein kinase/Flp pilus assembly protein TadD
MSAKPGIDTIFCSAIDIDSPEERRALVERACAGDANLKQHVERLLHAHFHGRGILDAPVQPRATVAEPLGETAGTVIGPYKLLEQIGEGGMGTVWMAQQTEPVKRLVALKVIKAGMDTRQIIARFEAERQALALMDHAHIARVLDGGQTPPAYAGGSPRPYFVMDLVKGVPITKYCDDHHLTPRQRLELFLPVCQAVQHAHQKGIIHRDLKPSNVLVALYDGRPVPKVIDFGVAKAAGHSLTDKTLVTGFGNLVGTLEYMSPEQAEVNQLDIDTRSDIYSLGVLLYELLTGTTPFTKKDLEKAGMLEMLRLIREEEPSKPSTKLSTAEGLPTLAANRGTEPAKLTKLLRGELDWIVMKALEKDRTRRYETANGFAMDVQRYLSDEAVLACPPSARYRLRKFARRHRSGLAVAALVLLFLVLLGSGAGWTWRDRTARAAARASQLEQATERAELLQLQGRRGEALAALERARLLAREAEPAPAVTERIDSVQDLLAAEGRDDAFVAQFEAIRRDVQTEVNFENNTFTTRAAFPRLRDALEQYGIAMGVTPPSAVVTAIQQRPAAVQTVVVAALDECLRQVQTPQADRGTFEWLLEVLRTVDSDPWRNAIRGTWQHPQTLPDLVKDLDVRRHPPSFLLIVVGAMPLASPSRLELARRVQFAYPGDFWANHALGILLRRAGKHAEAIRYHTAALAIRPDNPGVLVNRAVALRRAGESEAAIADLQRAIALAPRYAAAYNNLGNALQDRKQPEAAIRAYRTAIELDPELASAHYNLGNVLFYMNKLDEAIAAYRKAADCDPSDGQIHSRLAETYARCGRWDQAAVAYGRALALDAPARQAIAHDPDPGHLAFHAPRLLLAGDTDGYCRLCTRVIGKLGDAHEPHTAYLVARLCALAPGAVPDPARVVQIAERAVRAERAPHHLHTLGLAHYRAGQFDDAIKHLHSSIAGKWNANAANWLVLAMAHHGSGRIDEAQQWFNLAVRWMDDRGGNALRSLHELDTLACMVLRREAETRLGLRLRPAPDGKSPPIGIK